MIVTIELYMETTGNRGNYISASPQFNWNDIILKVISIAMTTKRLNLKNNLNDSTF